MREERTIEVAIWCAAGDPRVVKVAGALESTGLTVHDFNSLTTQPMVILLLPGDGGAGFAAACLRIVEAYPTVPAVVLHTTRSENAHPAVDNHVFELLPASLDLERVSDHVRAVLARWHRFEKLKNQATTLQQLESTTELIYFDFRPDRGTFCPSRQLRQIIGHEAASDAMAPSPFLDCIHTDDRALFADTLFQASRSGTPFCVQIRLADAKGRQRTFRMRGRAFGAIYEGSSSRVFGVCEDTTDHMQRLAESEARSRIDELTGLGNRRYFDDCLKNALARAKRERELLALIYIDLDRFKLINDTLGHDAGDQLLRIISARLSDAVRAQDIVCLDQDNPSTAEARVSRLGGDEFTILLSEIHGPEDAELVATRILNAIKQPVELMGQTLSPSASVGIAIFPADGNTTDVLRKRADAALYSAKGSGGGFRFFKQSMEDSAVRRLSIEHELRSALDRDEIELHYQPRVDNQNDRIVGAEALIRWSSPTLGRVKPEEFLHIAEETGFISTLGRWTLIKACQEAVFWLSSEEPIRLSVNVSPVQFEQDDVFSAVVDALKRSGFPPDLLDLEITESLLLRDDPSIGQSLEELRRMGVRIVLDDFGKGYSALAVLMSQPLDVLKLDRRLIETIAPDGEGSRLLANVIRMAHDLNLHTIAEGVSHADQAEFLSKHDCHEMQGFYFSAAIPADVFREKLQGE